MMSNKSLAEFNLSKEPQLKEAKQRLLETYEKAIEVFKEAETKKRQIGNFIIHHSVNVVEVLVTGL